MSRVLRTLGVWTVLIWYLTKLGTVCLWGASVRSRGPPPHTPSRCSRRFYHQNPKKPPTLMSHFEFKGIEFNEFHRHAGRMSGNVPFCGSFPDMDPYMCVPIDSGTPPIPEVFQHTHRAIQVVEPTPRRHILAFSTSDPHESYTLWAIKPRAEPLRSMDPIHSLWATANQA